MNARRTNLLLRTIAIAATIAAASIVVVATALPGPTLKAASGLSEIAAPTSRPAAIDTMPSPRAIALVADVPLRRSLADARRPLALATTRPATLGFTLRGTIVEPGRSFAVFATAKGAAQVCEAGERIEGAEVLAITAVDVTLRVGDRSIVLDVPRPPAIGAFGT